MTVSEPGLKCDSVWDPLLSYFENQNTLLPNVFVLVTANVDIITYFLCMHIYIYILFFYVCIYVYVRMNEYDPLSLI